MRDFVLHDRRLRCRLLSERLAYGNSSENIVVDPPSTQVVSDSISIEVPECIRAPPRIAIHADDVGVNVHDLRLCCEDVIDDGITLEDPVEVTVSIQIAVRARARWRTRIAFGTQRLHTIAAAQRTAVFGTGLSQV